MVLVVLTISPFLLFRLQAEKRSEWDQDRLLKNWQRKALTVSDDFRAGYTFETQIETLMGRVLWPFRRLRFSPAGTGSPSPSSLGSAFLSSGSLGPDSLGPDSLGQALSKAFLARIPKPHRPTGTRLFGFKCNFDGQMTILTAEGLSFAGGRVIGELLRGLSRPNLLTREDRTKLHNRCLRLFGEFATFDLLAFSGRSRLLPVLFEGVRAFIYWDSVKLTDGTALAILAIFPRSAQDSAKPLEYALSKARGKGGKFFPLLVPIESASGSLKMLVPADSIPARVIKRLRASLIDVPIRERHDFKAGMAFEGFSGYWILRDAVEGNLPYELWLLSKRPAKSLSLPMSNPGFLLSLLAGSISIAWFFRTVVLGLPLSVPIRTWFLVFFLLTGAAPLVVFYLITSFMIDTRSQRRMEDAVVLTTRTLEDVDTGINSILSKFGKTCREKLDEPGFREDLRLHLKDSVTPRILSGFQGCSDAGFPIRFALVFRFGRDISSLIAPGQPPNIHRGFLDFFMPIIEGIAIRESPEKEKAVLESLTGSEKFLLSAIGYTMKASVYKDLFNLRNRGQIFTEGRETTFWYLDFLSDRNSLEMAVMFRAEAIPSFIQYLKNACGRLFAIHPDWRLLAGRISPGGLEPIARCGEAASETGETSETIGKIETGETSKWKKLWECSTTISRQWLCVFRAPVERSTDSSEMRSSLCFWARLYQRLPPGLCAARLGCAGRICEFKRNAPDAENSSTK